MFSDHIVFILLGVSWVVAFHFLLCVSSPTNNQQLFASLLIVSLPLSSASRNHFIPVSNSCLQLSRFFLARAQASYLPISFQSLSPMPCTASSTSACLVLPCPGQVDFSCLASHTFRYTSPLHCSSGTYLTLLKSSSLLQQHIPSRS